MRSRKGNIDLVCSVAELAGLFEKRSNIEGFLQNVVDLVAGHMHSDVCSVYLFESESREVVLRATRGLHPSSIGKVRLKIGEGITGLALKELRPISEAKASQSPFFKAIPGIDEEQYEAFLAVPIRRGLTRIGVITLQDRRAGFFDSQDAKALRAIASQLAATLENAELLMEMHAEGDGTPAAGGRVASGPMAGMVASDGIAMGRAAVLGALSDVGLDDDTPAEPQNVALKLLETAVDRTEEQLEALQRDMEDDLADVATLIFSAHLLMLRDSEFSGRMMDLVSYGRSPRRAVFEVVEHFTRIFSESKSPRVQEKVQDVQDLGHRILMNLSGESVIRADYRGAVVVTSRLFPSELVRLVAQNAEGIVVSGGDGVTSHISILSRSLGIPVLFVSDDAVLRVEENAMLVLDGEQGQLFVEPAADMVQLYRERIADKLRIHVLPGDLPEDCTTCDEVEVDVLANVNLLQDARLARRNKADGIGLYRSEFPFIVRDEFPSEEEQYATYRRIIEAVDGREVNLRTLDIGGDKLLRFLPDAREANPFLGLRGIRFSLANREIFEDQLRAMLRAGVNADLRIMFPMVSSLDEYLEARDVLDRCLDELRRDGIPHNERPKVGAMIELPSAVESVPDLSREADFLCIGTNDLIMYMLAVDRTNESVGALYQSYHPSVLKSLRRIAEGAGAKLPELSVCGEAAADPLMVPFFLGIGIRKISVEPKHIPSMKQRVSDIVLRDAEEYARQMLSFSRLRDVQHFVGEARNELRSPTEGVN